MSGMLMALALFGCSDDGVSCQRLAAPVQSFESRAQCEASLEAALRSDAAMRADYPDVVALCLAPTVLARLGGGMIDLSSRTVQVALR